MTTGRMRRALRGYDAAVLPTQINTALAAFANPQGQAPADNLMRDAMRSVPAIAAALETQRQTLRQTDEHGFEDGLLFDADNKVTSLYDLRMFRAFIDQKQALFGVLTAPVREASLTFPADEFWVHGSVATAPAAPGGAPPRATALPEGELIQGPDATLPLGMYRAALDATLSVAGPGHGALRWNLTSRPPSPPAG